MCLSVNIANPGEGHCHKMQPMSVSVKMQQCCQNCRDTVQISYNTTNSKKFKCKFQCMSFWSVCYSYFTSKMKNDQHKNTTRNSFHFQTFQVLQSVLNEIAQSCTLSHSNCNPEKAKQKVQEISEFSLHLENFKVGLYHGAISWIVW